MITAFTYFFLVFQLVLEVYDDTLLFLWLKWLWNILINLCFSRTRTGSIRNWFTGVKYYAQTKSRNHVNEPQKQRRQNWHGEISTRWKQKINTDQSIKQSIKLSVIELFYKNRRTKLNEKWYDCLYVTSPLYQKLIFSMDYYSEEIVSEIYSTVFFDLSIY